ncbi:MAG: hypothetical protein Kow0042_10860 [Calditrichia bacterium]
MTDFKEEKTSIIIVTYNALDYVRKCVQSLLANTDPIHEIIIVDNASGAETREYLLSLKKYPQIKLILNEKNLLWCPGNNVGLRESAPDSKYCLLLNSDVEIFRPDWLAKLQAPMNKYANVGITGTQYNFSHIGPTYGGIDGCCFMFRKRLLDIVGYLDERFPWNGAGYVFTVNAWAKGWYYYFVHCPDLMVHYGKRSRISNRTQKQNIRVNKIEVIREAGLKPTVNYWAYFLNRLHLFNINRRMSRYLREK